ncbi:MAG: hypothetical protein ACLFUB_19505 [Cyclobacteriaceae bacterium]
MLSYFRVNDPYRAVGVFLLLILTRFPFLASDVPLSLPELNWMLAGERLSEGWPLYSGLWDNIGPLAALIYALIEWVFDRSQTVYVILAILLTTYQAMVFNIFLLNKKAYNENTYVPALVYILVASFFFDFFLLSPVLISLTWILLALRNVFYRIESRSRDNRILSTGIYLGLATLCYLPSLIFLFSTMIAYFLFASLSFRRYLLLFYGTAMPLLLAFTYFFLMDAHYAFVNQYLLAFQELANDFYIEPLQLLYVSIVPLVFLLISAYRLGQLRRFTNQQTKLQQIMFIKIVASLVSLLFVSELAPYHLLPFVPPLAFFITHYLLSIRRILLAELATFLLGLLLVLNAYAFLFGYFSLARVYDTQQELLTQTTAYDEVVAGKRVLVMGDNLSVYRNARLATPYLDWGLAQKQLSSIEYFEDLTSVYANFSRDMPQVIIDLQGLMPDLQQRLPLLQQSYRQMPGRESVYLLKEGEN